MSDGRRGMEEAVVLGSEDRVGHTTADDRRNDARNRPRALAGTATHSRASTVAHLGPTFPRQQPISTSLRLPANSLPLCSSAPLSLCSLLPYGMPSDAGSCGVMACVRWMVLV